MGTPTGGAAAALLVGKPDRRRGVLSVSREHLVGTWGAGLRAVELQHLKPAVFSYRGYLLSSGCTRQKNLREAERHLTAVAGVG